jgi:hypothetical protein
VGSVLLAFFFIDLKLEMPIGRGSAAMNNIGSNMGEGMQEGKT